MSLTDPARWSADPEAPAGVGELLKAAREVAPTAGQKAALAGQLGLTGALGFATAAKGLAAFVVLGGGAWWAAASWGGASSSDSTASDTVTVGAPATSAGDAEPARPNLEHPQETLSPDNGAATQGAMQTTAPGTDPAGVRTTEASSRGPDALAPPRQNSEAPTPQGNSGADAAAGVPSEAQLLLRARALLAEGPQQALALLARHEQLYPQGVLAQERESLRVRALKAAGKLDRAEEQEARFRSAHPDSVLSTDVE